MNVECLHLNLAHPVAAHTQGCEQCLRDGDAWVHLRMCLVCGFVGCCDSSKNKHATRHYYTTGHPVMRSIEPGESWGWCYVDQVWLDVHPPPAPGLVHEAFPRPA